MDDLVELTEAEIGEVAGGTGSIKVSFVQSSSYTVSQTATYKSAGMMRATVNGGSIHAGSSELIHLEFLGSEIEHIIEAAFGNIGIMSEHGV